MLGKVGISIPFAATVAFSSVWAVFSLAVRKSPLERRSAQYRKRYAAIGGECRHKAASAHMSPHSGEALNLPLCGKVPPWAARAHIETDLSGFVMRNPRQYVK